MVEFTPIIRKEQIAMNPTIGDKLKSAVGLGDTVRTATTINKNSSSTTVPLTSANLAAATVSTDVPLKRHGSASSLSSLSSVEDDALGKEGLGSKLKRKLHVGHTNHNTAATMALPVVASSTTTTAAVITEKPVITTKLHAPVVAEVHTQKNITIENREVISQNIVKPVIEMHEKHIQRNITEAPVMTQAVNPTLVQEIGRENLKFVAPIAKIETAVIDHGAKVQNVKMAPLLAEVHHKPVIERHEQVIIHENVNESLTEIRTQPIVQNIYEKPTIVRTVETVVESAPAVITAPVVATAPVVTSVPVAIQATTVLHRSDSASSISSLSSIEDEAVAKESLGSKIKRKLHRGPSNTTATAVTVSNDSFTEKPRLKDRIKSKILHKNAPF